MIIKDLKDLFPIVLSYINQNSILLLQQTSNNISEQITEYIKRLSYNNIMKVESNESLKNACKNLYIISIKDISIIFDEGAWNLGLFGACDGGEAKHRELARLMIDKGANDWNWGT